MNIKQSTYNFAIITLMLIAMILNIVICKQIVERNRLLTEVENQIKSIERNIK